MEIAFGILFGILVIQVFGVMARSQAVDSLIAEAKTLEVQELELLGKLETYELERPSGISAFREVDFAVGQVDFLSKEKFEKLLEEGEWS